MTPEVFGPAINIPTAAHAATVMQPPELIVTPEYHKRMGGSSFRCCPVLLMDSFGWFYLVHSLAGNLVNYTFRTAKGQCGMSYKITQEFLLVPAAAHSFCLLYMVQSILGLFLHRFLNYRIGLACQSPLRGLGVNGLQPCVL